MDLSAIQNIGPFETIWILVFDKTAGNFKTQNVVCKPKNVVFGVSWNAAEVTGMRAACVTMVTRGYYCS